MEQSINGHAVEFAGELINLWRGMRQTEKRKGMIKIVEWAVCKWQEGRIAYSELVDILCNLEKWYRLYKKARAERNEKEA